jgi:hypothetical protein
LTYGKALEQLCWNGTILFPFCTIAQIIMNPVIILTTDTFTCFWFLYYSFYILNAKLCSSSSWSTSLLNYDVSPKMHKMGRLFLPGNAYRPCPDPTKQEGK